MRYLRIFLLLILLGSATSAPTAGASPPIEPPALWVMDSDGGNHDRLIRHAYSHAPDIEWSPDGQFLLLESSVIVALASDGSGETELTEWMGDAPIYSTWSPDGTRIAFSLRGGKATGFNTDIFTVDVESGETTRLTTDERRDLSAAWSPDSQRLAFVRTGRTGGLFVMDADGSNAQRLIGGIQGEPVWSPDGAWIATADGNPYRDIWVTTPDGTGVANITHSRADELQFAWSPDSERLVFANYYRGSIVVIDRDGRRRQTIFHRKDRGANWPVWSPDGARILFSADDIFTISPDGNGLRNLTPGPRYGRQPVYSPDGSRIAYER